MPDGDGPLPAPPMLDADEAAAIATLLDPLQSATGIGASFGQVLEDAPYPPVRLMGNLLQLNAQTVNTALIALEGVPNALTVYADAQERGAEALLPPPPDKLVADLRKQTEPLREAQERLERHG